MRHIFREGGVMRGGIEISVVEGTQGGISMTGDGGWWRGRGE